MATPSQDVKRWIFSGIVQKTDEVTLRKYIEELGGVIVDRENKYTFFCTHVLVREFYATEKILAALAAGKWILEYKYVEDSYRQRRWLDESKYEITLHEKVSKFCRMRKDVGDGGVYKGWAFYVYLGNKILTRSIRRIIAAGDGEVVSDAKLSSADVVISEKALVAEVRNRVGPALPIISFHYLKEVLIMKKDPSVLEKYMLDGRGKSRLPQKNKIASPAPCVIVQEKVSSAPKRPIVEVSLISNKKHCSKVGKKCPPTPYSKQTKLDQFLTIGSSTGRGASSPLPVGFKTSKALRRQASCIDLSPEASTSSITKPSLSGAERKGHIGKEDKIEIIHIDVEEYPIKKTQNNDDCFITKIEKVNLGLLSEKRKVYFMKDIEILKESCKGVVAPKQEVYITTIDGSAARLVNVNPREINKSSIQNDGVISIDDMELTEGSSKENSVKTPEQLNSKCVRQLKFTGENKESIVVDTSVKNSREIYKDLPGISEKQQSIKYLNVEPMKMPVLTSIHSSLIPNVEKERKSDQKEKVVMEKISTIQEAELREPQGVGIVLSKEDINKLPEKVKKEVDPKATQIRYSSGNMKRTVMKFIEHTKVINQVNISHANHSKSKLTQQHSLTQSANVDDLTYLLNPVTSFQYSTSVRELSAREVAYYESSTDEDTMDSKMAETEKGIIIMGIESLQLFVTTYTYPPPSTFGHLLQRIVFETPFRLAHTRAIDLAYRILKYFPPVNSEMQKYYVEVLKSAAMNEKNFYDKLNLPWKFILRPIEALQANLESIDDSSMSSSCENEAINKKDNSLGLLDFIIALLSEDLKQPNCLEAVREHLTWQIFWGQSQDPRDITSPIKKLLCCWMSMHNAPIDVRHCLGKLVAMVMELAWRFERCLLVPISPLPVSFEIFADVLRHRIQGCESETLMQLMYDLPTPWSRSIFGSIIFQSEAQIKEHEITLGDMVEYGLISEKQEDSKEKISDSTNVKIKSSSPQKKQQKNVNKRGSKGETKLMQACMKDNVAKLKELLMVPGIDINLPDYSGWTPLHEAAIRGHDACVKALLKYDCSGSLDMKNTLHLYLRRAHYYSCNVLAQSEDGQTALHDAVENDHITTAQLLLDHEGEGLLRILNKKNKTPMILCKSREMQQLLKSYEGKAPSKDSKKRIRFGKCSLFHSGLASSRRFLLSYEDRKKFILLFINNFVESSGVRFCRYDMMIETYNLKIKHKAQTQSQVFHGSHHLPSSSSSAESSNGPKETCGGNRSLKEISQLLPSYEIGKITDLEMTFFEQIYESTVNCMKLCRDLTATVQGSVEEPKFVIALRSLVE